MWVFISKPKLMITGVICLILLAAGIMFNYRTRPAGQANVRGYLALVIDDFGNHSEGTEDIINLEVPLTAAVMPFLPFSRVDADLAHQAGLEVIMHIPMEPVHGKPSWLGPKAITCGLDDQEIKNRLRAGLKELKWAVGMNNHMGSKAMQDAKIVRAILEVARQENLYFLDSRTTTNTAVVKTAEMLNYPYLARDEFLDGCKNLAHIKKQLRKLGAIALRRGYAIGIGHVGKEGGSVTARAIREIYPELAAKGICLVFVSQIREVAAYSRE